MALYRKYRPATFGEVVGQEHVTRPLSVALDAGRINHAYLFSGPRGCGKTSSARILARSLNCEQGPTSTPCGVCNSCRSLAPGGPGNLDVTELDAASHNGVDDMRELRDRAFFAPADSRYRVFIIDEAHMITAQGSNALLKIVEEPPEHLIFIFATTEPEKVIGTIRSRTHHYPFRLLTPMAMRGLLERTCEAEGVYVEDSVFPLVIRAGGGSPRDSLSVLDQLLAGAGPDGLTYDLAIPLLGVTDYVLIDAAIEALAARDGAKLFLGIDNVIEAGYDPRRFAMDLLDRLRDLMLLHVVPDALSLGLVEAPAGRAEVLAEQSRMFSSGDLSRFAALVNASLPDMRGTTSPRLLVEILCARMLMGEAPASVIPTEPAVQQAPAVAPPARKFERRSQRLAREAAKQTGEAARPQEEAKPQVEVERQPEARQEVKPKAEATPPPEQPIERIRRKWAHIFGLVGKTNEVAEIMLTGAKVLGIRDNTLVIGHTTGALATRINDPSNNKSLVSVLRDELGYDLGVQCVIGTDPLSAGFHAENTAPEWKPEAPKPKPPTVLVEPSQPPAPAPKPVEPEPKPEPKATSVWDEPAKLGGPKPEPAAPNPPASTQTPQPSAPAPSARKVEARKVEARKETAAESGGAPKRETEKPRKRWEEAVARGNESLRRNPKFSDGVPLPPEPPDPYGVPPEDVPAAQYEEEEAMVREASTGQGTRDHRDARTVAIEMLEKELGARPL